MAIIKGTMTPENTIGGKLNVQKTVVAESNAEMIDARKGHDGTWFETIGEAIRTQVSRLWNAFNEIPAWAKEATKPSYTAKEVGAVTPEELNASRTAVNLLDNSDFRNPINQRDKTLYTGTGYGIDRWKCSSANWNVSVEDGHIRFYSDNLATTGMLTQNIPITSAMRGKTVTMVARVKGDYVRLNVNGATGSYNRDASEWVTLIKTATVPDEGDTFPVSLQNNKLENTTGFLCEWVALYEGEFTAETIPEYVHKGYVTELMNCRRYFVALDGHFRSHTQSADTNLYNIQIQYPVKMRTFPTLSYDFSTGDSGMIYSISAGGDSADILCTSQVILKNVTASADY